ncbi:MAG: helix-turn-helix domain-containing protein [Actinomycetes bacterium]
MQGQLARFFFRAGVLHVKPEPVLGRLGRGLERVRTTHGLTQADLARLAGVTPSAISQAETGHRGLSLETLVALSEALPVSLDELMNARPTDYLVSRCDRVGTSGPTVVLLDDPSTGVRATLVRLGPFESGGPDSKGGAARAVGLILVASGLIQAEVGGDSPLLRAPDALLSSSTPIRAWRNLLREQASLVWVTHKR